jgi:hypothetical protein
LLLLERIRLETYLSYVAFADAALPIADEWFQEPIQSISVKILGPFSATADGACQVALPDGVTIAYVKPRSDVERKLVVAREKIAADLAHILELPVAPVVVRLPMPDEGWPYHTAMSLSCLKSGRLWLTGGAAHLPAAGEALEALRVFWTWIGDGDHNAHPQNLLFEVLPDRVAVVAIDHSYSLCHHNAADPLAVRECQGYGTKGDFQGTAAATTVKIRSLNLNRIETTVRKMNPILTGEEQERMLRILNVRRDHLGRLLGLEE